MAKAAEKDPKDKKDAKDAKKGGGEEMIEKPREPMFSKNGFIVLIGAVILTAVLMAALVFMMTAGGGGDGAKEEKSVGSAPYGDIEYIAVDSAVAIVPSGGQTKTVRFNVLIGPEGGAAERQNFITHFSTANRDKLLRGDVIALMNAYDFEIVSDVRSFKPQYESELKKRLNNLIPSSVGKVAVVTLTEIRWD